jgi:NADPH2:quinone reductase
MRTHAFMVHETGGPAVLRWEDVDLPDAGRGDVLIRNTAVGVNFADIYLRRGQNPARLPTGLGIEGVGVVEGIGPGVKAFKRGDRVGYAGGARPGSYAEACIHTAEQLVKLPRWLDDKIAAAALTKGMTVQYLFNRTHRLRPGETILFHAAAGGVGLIACQWARAVGATMIGTVSTDEKAQLAKRNGCKHVIVTGRRNVAEEVNRLTNGQGVDVVYDSIGKDSWADSLKSVKKLGLVVCFGTASGPPPPYDVVRDGLANSAYVHRATTVNYMTSDEIRQKAARHLFRMLKSGTVKIRIGGTYPLRDAPRAQDDMERRRTTGSLVLLP